jgi:Domain of unknown function (DUF1707)
VGSVSISKTAGARSSQAPQVRIGDAERQEAARQLEQHFAEGRLTWEELDERLQTAYAARVTAELTPLFADLPDLPPPPAPPATVRSRGQQMIGQLSSLDMRVFVMLGLLGAVIAGALELHIWPVFALWAFLVFGVRGRRHHRGPRYGHHHGR